MNTELFVRMVQVLNRYTVLAPEGFIEGDVPLSFLAPIGAQQIFGASRSAFHGHVPAAVGGSIGTPQRRQLARCQLLHPRRRRPRRGNGRR